MIDDTRANIIIPRDSTEDKWTPNIPASILSPMNISMKARPFCKWWNLCRIFSIKKKSARKPIIANMFDVNTTNIFCEILNTAGIESTANIISVASTKRTIMKREVK